MKNVAYLTTLFLLLAGLSLNAQDLAGQAGGMAGAVTTAEGGWMSFHNQAGITSVDTWEVGVFWENRFLSSELNNRGFYAVKGLGKGRAVGLNYRSFGYELYGNSRLGLTYAMELNEKLTAGIQLDYYQLRFGDIYGKTGAVSFQGGAQFKPADAWVLAFHVTNPLQIEWSEDASGELAQKMDLGVRYIFSDKLAASAQVEKYIRELTNLRVGVDYEIKDPISVRFGYATYPSAMHLGVGYHAHGLEVSVASAWYQTLGFSPQIAISYAPAKN